MITTQLDSHAYGIRQALSTMPVIHFVDNLRLLSRHLPRPLLQDAAVHVAEGL